MKEKLKTDLPYIAVAAALFFLLPLIYYFLPDESLVPFIILATVNPVVLAVLSVVGTVRHGFSLWFHLAAALLFVGSVFVYYDVGTLPYVIYYFAVTAIFAIVAAVFRKDGD